ncbi:hypothetical protein H0H93_000862, partial [Arthromyces matolae]
MAKRREEEGDADDHTASLLSTDLKRPAFTIPTSHIPLTSLNLNLSLLNPSSPLLLIPKWIVPPALSLLSNNSSHLAARSASVIIFFPLPFGSRSTSDGLPGPDPESPLTLVLGLPEVEGGGELIDLKVIDRCKRCCVWLTGGGESDEKK